ncbi:hypothetical protein FE257_003164 [Aspergillus nanangensis]|uniref:Uncharacterized protein n=1 Tax=Aspergillus nanangensis TaxID=2582783 RepID=A0AAD4CBT7_ASPNN|nr:hypothetical protein FE257_003164 [Aspergillus nanangensis]
MKLSIFVPLTITLASSASAWIVNDYAKVTDCDVIPDGSFRSYEGSGRGTCHSFGSGDATTTCSVHSNGGRDVTEGCPKDISVSASVLVREAPNCIFYPELGCQGSAKVIASGTCVAGAFKSFNCP